MRVTVYEVVYVGLYAESLKSLAEVVGSVLSVVVGYHDGTHHEVAADELIAKAQHVLVVCDAEVGADFVLHDVLCADYDDYLYLVAELAEHAQLGVRLEAWQHAAGMMVVEELSAQFQVQLTLELLYAVLDVP